MTTQPKTPAPSQAPPQRDMTQFSFDLDESMIQIIHGEFDPEKVSAAYAELVKATPAEKLPAAAQKFFEDWGTRWMNRSLELGEKYSDRTYDMLREAADKTGVLAFPLIPERFVEIAYLSTQPIYTVPIVENGARGLTFKMAFCDYYKGFREKVGEEIADKLHCKHMCLSACHTAFEAFGFKVTAGMDYTMPEDGFCQFSIRRAEPTISHT
ncbi:MAG: hypothetical protein EXR60_05745 [Dehalococcoidia bacterium]|nr:hypothetical protein [Dehalococcoidia bacterium]